MDIPKPLHQYDAELAFQAADESATVIWNLLRGVYADKPPEVIEAIKQRVLRPTEGYNKSEYKTAAVNASLYGLYGNETATMFEGVFSRSEVGQINDFANAVQEELTRRKISLELAKKVGLCAGFDPKQFGLSPNYSKGIFIPIRPICKGKENSESFPICKLSGNKIAYWRERKMTAQKAKYGGPGGRPSYLYSPFGDIPQLLQLKDENLIPPEVKLIRERGFLNLVESELATLALIEAGIPAVGMMGVWNYQKDSFLHLDYEYLFEEMARLGIELIFTPDTCHRKNANVIRACRKLAFILFRDFDINASVCELEPFEVPEGGPDDFVACGGDYEGELTKREPITSYNFTVTTNHIDGTPLGFDEIVKHIVELCGGNLYNVYGTLGTIEEDGTFRTFGNENSFFGWASTIGTGPAADWNNGAEYFKRKDFFEQLHFSKNVPHYQCVSLVDQRPRLPDSLYLHEVEPKVTGKLDELIDLFSLVDPVVDRTIAKAAVVTICAGLPAGKKPLIVVSADTVGQGKTEIVKQIIKIGGKKFVDMEGKENAEKLGKKFVNGDQLGSNIAFADNVKSHKWANSAVEKFVTADDLCGWKNYVGDVSRPNYISWFATFNTPEAGKDISSRVVELKVEIAEYSYKWEKTIASFVEQNRDAIVADCLEILEGPELEITEEFRFGTWSYEVLAKVCGDVKTHTRVVREIKRRQELINIDRVNAQHYGEAFYEWVRTIAAPTSEGNGKPISLLDLDYVWFKDSAIACFYQTMLDQRMDSSTALKVAREIINFRYFEAFSVVHRGPKGAESGILCNCDLLREWMEKGHTSRVPGTSRKYAKVRGRVSQDLGLQGFTLEMLGEWVA